MQQRIVLQQPFFFFFYSGLDGFCISKSLSAIGCFWIKSCSVLAVSSVACYFYANSFLFASLSFIWWLLSLVMIFDCCKHGLSGPSSLRVSCFSLPAVVFYSSSSILSYCFCTFYSLGVRSGVALVAIAVCNPSVSALKSIMSLMSSWKPTSFAGLGVWSSSTEQFISIGTAEPRRAFWRALGCCPCCSRDICKSSFSVTAMSKVSMMPWKSTNYGDLRFLED